MNSAVNSAAPLISVIIPNWNGAHHLPECLQSLRTQQFQNFETLVVDNGSSDESIELLARDFDWVRVIPRDDNGGFSKAVNDGIRQSRAAFIVLLNNDTRAEPDWLAALHAGMQRYPEASLGASRMLLYDPPHLVDSAGDGYSMRLGAGYNLASGQPSKQVDQDAWVFGACAGAAIYRRSLFDDIGLFDEDFFLIFEDVDIALRAQVAGHRCVYLADAMIFHKRGSSTDNSSLEVIIRAWRNTIWVAGKNLPPFLLLIWFVLFAFRMVQMFGMAILGRAWRKIRPTSRVGYSAGTPAKDWRQGVVAKWYWPTLKTALLTLPKKRSETRPQRRKNSFQLLPILMRPRRPVDSVGIKSLEQ